MIFTHKPVAGDTQTVLERRYLELQEPIPEDTVWLDLVRPTREEEVKVESFLGITVPTRVAFRESGWDAMLKTIDVKKYHFEEEQQVEIPLSHPQRLRDYLFTPEPIARADFFVNLPKFKAHPWTTVTFSLKAYIGIQDDRHRLIDHDHKLNEKIAEITRNNAEANFALAMKLAESKDVSQAMELQTEHARKQMESFVPQLEEIRDLAAQVIQDSTPPGMPGGKP